MLVLNLRAKTDSNIFSTDACRCWGRMEKAVQCSVRGLKDEFESYVAGVLDVAVIPEIETAIANKCIGATR